jgi:DNA-directed RNA polymerase subunit delta
LRTYSISYSPELAKETPMIDIAYDILNSTEPEETPYLFRELMQEVLKVKGLEAHDEKLLQLSAHLWTDITIDGRFAINTNRTWGLKSWKSWSKEEILNLDEGVEEEDDVADGELGDIESGTIRALGEEDEVVAGEELPETQYKLEGDPYAEDEEDIDSKSVDDEGLPPIDDEIPLEEIKLEEDDFRDDDEHDDDGFPSDDDK